MKRLLLILFAIFLITSPVQGEFFKDIIVTSPTGIWTDSRAYTTLSAAITAIGASEQDLYIAKEEVVTTLVIPANIRLHFVKDGAIANSNTLTINTKNIHSDHQIFTGAGAVNFASGTEVRSVWFEDFETAITQTSNDTVTLLINKTDTLLNSAAVGNNVLLKWNASNLITITAGQTLSNIGDISAPSVRLFVISGNITFRSSSSIQEIDANWFGSSLATLSLADAAAAAAGKSLTFSGPWVIDIDLPLSSHIKALSGTDLQIATTKNLTINGTLDAGLYQIFSCTGTGKVLFARGAVSYVCPEWWYSGSGSYHTALNAAYKAFDGLYTSVKLSSQVYTVTNSPWLIDEVRAGEIVGSGKGISTIYQSGTGPAISIQTGATSCNLTFSHFSIIGNPTSSYGIVTTGAMLKFFDLDITNHGSHGWYSIANGWNMTFRDVNSNSNGGSGFKWDYSCDMLQMTGGNASLNTVYGIHCAVTQLSKSVLIQGVSIYSNGSSGAMLSYGQYNFNSNYLESNVGIQLHIYNCQGGAVTGNSFYDSTGVSTYGMYLNSDTTNLRTRAIQVSGNIFQGMLTANIVDIVHNRGCIIGPNKAWDGVNILVSTSNIIFDDDGIYTGIGNVKRTTGTTPPTNGIWGVGDYCENTNLVVGQPVGWGCTVAGGSYSVTRANTTSYNDGAWALWTTGTTVWRCVAAGISANSPPSIVGKVVGNTVNDGTVIWQLMSLSVTSSTWVPGPILVAVLTAPAVPASAVEQANANAYPVRVTVIGGTVSAIAIGPPSGTVVTGATTGAFILQPGHAIKITYTGAPTWTWAGM